MPPAKARRWFWSLTDDQRRQLLELKEAYQSGKLPGWTGNDLYREVVRPSFGLELSTETFRKWMTE